MSASEPTLWIVVPCYNEEAVLPITAPLFLNKLKALICSKKVSEESRILFVNDGSRDMTWNIICELAQTNKHILGISQSRNRGHQNALLAAAYSWILVQRKDIDGAYKALIHALEKSDNETLKANREHLANNRVAHFSNAGLGEQWYALMLEEPKVRQQRPRMQWR